MAFPERLRLWGIGGVGMSAIAQHLLRLGHQISGYDREPSPFTDILDKLKVPIDYVPSLERLQEAEGIIYTPAIPSDFPEWSAVQVRRLPTWRRAQALAMIADSYEVIAVAGAHGKTTTSAILTWLLHAIGESPTGFVGGLMRNFGNNYLAGSSPWMIVEADEYDRAMLLLHPQHAILQSIDPDHLEIYGSPKGLEDAYRAFVQQVKGLLVLGPSVPDLGRQAIRYTLRHYEAQGERITFAYEWQGHKREAAWGQIGRHFAENAAAALTLLEALGFDFDRLRNALMGFCGVARRMEVIPVGDHVIVSDYAHHPTEILRTLEALREAFPQKKLVAIFQPHLYSRTAFFAKEFAYALSAADFILLFPIYAAREPSTQHVSSMLISQHLSTPHVEVVPSDPNMGWNKLLSNQPPSVFAFMGAGDIYQMIPSVQLYLTEK
ncbi:MAG: cyanophycin synthetase [Bacteroidia bacterium]|nr:cyanophycin synthetase [Bacteroidia bacterium]